MLALVRLACVLVFFSRSEEPRGAYLGGAGLTSLPCLVHQRNSAIPAALSRCKRILSCRPNPCDLKVLRSHARASGSFSWSRALVQQLFTALLLSSPGWPSRGSLVAGPGAACGKPGKPHHSRALVGRRFQLAVQRSPLSVAFRLRAAAWQGSAHGQGAWRTCTAFCATKRESKQRCLSSSLALCSTYVLYMCALKVSKLAAQLQRNLNEKWLTECLESALASPCNKAQPAIAFSDRHQLLLKRVARRCQGAVGPRRRPHPTRRRACRGGQHTSLPGRRRCPDARAWVGRWATAQHTATPRPRWGRLATRLPFSFLCMESLRV